MTEEEETEGLMQYINRVNKEAEDKATKISNFTIEDFEEMIRKLDQQRPKDHMIGYYCKTRGMVFEDLGAIDHCSDPECGWCSMVNVKLDNHLKNYLKDGSKQNY